MKNFLLNISGNEAPDTVSSDYGTKTSKLLNNQYTLYLIHRQTWMLRTVVIRLRISHLHSFFTIKIGFYKCQSYGQISLNCSMMKEKKTVWMRAPMERTQKNVIAIRVLWFYRNTRLVFKNSGRKETSRWHTKYLKWVCVCVRLCVCVCQCVCLCFC